MSRIVTAAAILLMACGCGGGPAAPSAPSSGTRLTLACDTLTIVAGDRIVCWVTQGLVNVSLSAAWTSSDPSIIRAEALGGVFTGKAEGQATLSAAHSGQTASTAVTVRLEDVLQASATADQGPFTVGATVTLWLQGFYGVASAESGTLTLVITDQNGRVVSTSAPMTVPRGGERYLISSRFTIPAGVTRVCRSGTLQIGSTTLTVVSDSFLSLCVPVTP